MAKALLSLHSPSVPKASTLWSDGLRPIKVEAKKLYKENFSVDVLELVLALKGYAPLYGVQAINCGKLLV